MRKFRPPFFGPLVPSMTSSLLLVSPANQQKKKDAPNHRTAPKRLFQAGQANLKAELAELRELQAVELHKAMPGCGLRSDADFGRGSVESFDGLHMDDTPIMALLTQAIIIVV